MIARSLLAVARFIANFLRRSVLVSRQYSDALSKSSTCSFEKGSIGGNSNLGTGTFFIGLGRSNSLQAQVQKPENAIQKLRKLFGERAVVKNSFSSRKLPA